MIHWLTLLFLEYLEELNLQYCFHYFLQGVLDLMMKMTACDSVTLSHAESDLLPRERHYQSYPLLLCYCSAVEYYYSIYNLLQNYYYLQLNMSYDLFLFYFLPN